MLAPVRHICFLKNVVCIHTNTPIAVPHMIDPGGRAGVVHTGTDTVSCNDAYFLEGLC